MKQVLSNYLEFPVTEADIKDFIAECGGGNDGTGNVTKKEFCKLYLSWKIRKLKYIYLVYKNEQDFK